MRMSNIRICKFVEKMIFSFVLLIKKSKVSIENLTNDSVVPIICETDLEMDLFVMGFQECKNAWTLVKIEKLEARIKP